ncbi:MAG: hypothetical protein HQL53_02760 [Magnetococcales bacterium]|nr:hypothetical protein [Magnetococcales bacterium]
MTAQANVKYIAEQLGIQSDQHTAYFDRETGEAWLVSEEEVMMAEDDTPLDERPEWQQEAPKITNKILSNEYTILQTRNRVYYRYI